MPTYRVMDSDGIIVDEDRKPLDVSDEEVLTWYKNMLTGASAPSSAIMKKSTPLKRTCQVYSQHYGLNHV